MDLTLIEQAKLALGRDETLRAAVMEIFANSSDLLQYLPFRNVTVTYDEDSKKTLVDDMENETIGIGGGDIDIDIELIKGNPTERAKLEIPLLKRLANRIVELIIKGNSENPYEFDGLQVRCKGGQLIDNSGALLLSKLDELITSVNNPTHLLMNKVMGQRLGVLNKEGRITMYKNLSILSTTYDKNYDELLSFTEEDPSGVPQCTSIYCLSLAEDGLVGLQVGPMEVRDLGELDTKPVYRTRIEWYIGLTTIRQKSIARLRYINDGVISV